MSGCVNLLLLLSALLSALTGIGGGVRPPSAAPAAMAQQVRTVSTIAERKVATRPVLALPRRIERAAAPLGRAFALAPDAPLYLLRRRE